MTTTEFSLPELGEGVESAEVSRVFVQAGETIAADQTVLELATDKAIADLPCPHSGRVTELHVREGQTVEIGQPILTLEIEPEEPAPQPAPPREEPPPTMEAERDQKAAREAEAPPQTPPETQEERTTEPPDSSYVAAPPERRAAPPSGPAPSAGPATRRLARQLGVELREVWSGEPGARVRPEDVARYFAQQSSRGPASPPPLPDFSRFGPVERQPLNPIYKTAAEHLSVGWQNVPQVTQNDLVDITELETARRRHQRMADPAGPKITLTPLILKALVAALREFPRFNASYDAARQELVLKRYYHFGVAVDTDRGLLVPVVRDVDRKPVRQIAAELIELAAKARAGKLTLADMQGGTFTLSNQGGIGGTSFTPLVSFPEVAILGLSRAETHAERTRGRRRRRTRLPLSLSYDHRVINGADAARFVVRLGELLRNPLELLLST